ncbi:CheB methylesterase [Pseudopedobacter saltans DSM 12145]|uniref:protein-glutamate methylesterase n=1 Tax=Pseudopedobacter saltans (strain ATCC 51119 / DSM 12145 / JCM 21818 / CCUG 39354 / LMG 10337 / NBRC 100064 / NCIMB 13643) TaxID=762903 RepID=F0S7K1_PSESL|nr:chemotaxis protein CheB [Pseudopedobacter saltans]ADY52261.1 CheB methylesterase [Pseudopedobacter saltans DSM 12145]
MRESIELIVIGGSAGAFLPVLDIVRSLPKGFKYPILIVLHRKYSSQYDLDKLLSEQSDVKIKEINDKERIEPGIAYLCPPDYHVLIEKEKIFSLDKSETLWYSRPSIDVAFESAIDVYGKKILGILLSGANRDGADGLLALKEIGGKTIVQDLQEAKFNAMPSAAISQAAQTMILTIEQIKEYLVILSANG